jgi:hypothetical protein
MLKRYQVRNVERYTSGGREAGRVTVSAIPIGDTVHIQIRDDRNPLRTKNYVMTDDEFTWLARAARPDNPS